MQRSADRILTTHAGSLPRPRELIKLYARRARGVIGDINSRRGRIEGMEHVGGSQVIKAMVPLKEMFGYVNDIRSSTQGRASYTMQFARYEEAPRMISEEIIGSNQGK